MPLLDQRAVRGLRLSVEVALVGRPRLGEAPEPLQALPEVVLEIGQRPERVGGLHLLERVGEAAGVVVGGSGEEVGPRLLGLRIHLGGPRGQGEQEQASGEGETHPSTIGRTGAVPEESTPVRRRSGGCLAIVYPSAR